MSLITDIRDTAEYKRFKGIVQTAQTRIKAISDQDEAMSLHASRSSRSIRDKKQYSPKHLIEAVSQDMAFRSRFVEMRVRCHLTTSQLDDAIAAISGFIATEFSDELKQFRTVGDRGAFINRVIAKAREVQSDGYATVELLDTLIKDIDASSHQLRQIVECLKLLDNSKSGQIV